jgi:hypothetical protein
MINVAAYRRKPSTNSTIKMIMMVYNIGNLLSDIVEDGLPVFGCPIYIEIFAGLNDPQQLQNNEDDSNNEQGVDDIACTRKARKKIRAEVSK